MCSQKETYSRGNYIILDIIYRMSNSQNLKLLVFGITEGNNNGERPHRKWVGAELANKN